MAPVITGGLTETPTKQLVVIIIASD